MCLRLNEVLEMVYSLMLILKILIFFLHTYGLASEDIDSSAGVVFVSCDLHQL